MLLSDASSSVLSSNKSCVMTQGGTIKFAVFAMSEGMNGEGGVGAGGR